MKKKNEQWLRYSNRALSGLLMLFGFVFCDNGGGDIPVEYGMPSAKYRVKGKVIDADTQEPVPGIEVVTGAVHTGDGKEWLSYPDTLITDKDGAFATERTEFPSKKYRFIVRDVDGDANGTYSKDSVEVEAGGFTGGSHWYRGETSIDKTIEIKKETAKDNEK